MDLAPGLKTEAAGRSPRDMAQRHGGFLRSSIALAHIAAEAGRGHVLPGVTTSPTAGDHMVDRQLIVTAAAERESSDRRAQVGSGDRSEKIRTYNYKDNRTTDHRLGRNFTLEPVLEGQLEDLIGACIAEEQRQKLEALSDQAEA